MSEIQSTNRYLWYLDPIDGTSNYTKQSEDFCINLGLLLMATLILILFIIQLKTPIIIKHLHLIHINLKFLKRNAMQ